MAELLLSHSLTQVVDLSLSVLMMDGFLGAESVSSLSYSKAGEVRNSDSYGCAF